MRALSDKAWRLILPMDEKIVLLRLADHADEGRQAFPSVAHLALHTGMSVRQVQRVLARLEGKGLIERHMRSARSTVYVVLPGIDLARRTDSPLKS